VELILWRHAEAEDGGPGQSDHERRLTARGAKQARKVARWFLAHRPKELRILASPAERAVQTAQALKLPFEIDARIGPGADTADLIAASGWPDADGAVMLVGHQPTLGRLAALVLSGREADWTIKKGALWWLRRPGGETSLIAAIAPELV